jgi:protoheme IX farnesyltransferase
MTPAVDLSTLPLVGRRVADYFELAKPRVVAMVLVTTLVGYYLGSIAPTGLWPLAQTLLATGLAAAGTLALNQLMEIDLDARMERTRRRPLPEGRVSPAEALVLGLALLVLGHVWLALAVGFPAMLVTAVIAVSYLLAYTPLKRVTPLCSLVGAIPGALPPVAGWAAARGSVGPEAWVLFAIMFLWQIPHSLAIGCIYRDDYSRAGIRLLPVIDRQGSSTGMHVLTNTLALLPVALLPTLVGLTGPIYFIAALTLGLVFLWSAVGLWWRGGQGDARRVLFASLVYLPVLLGVMALDKLAS